MKDIKFVVESPTTGRTPGFPDEFYLELEGRTPLSRCYRGDIQRTKKHMKRCATLPVVDGAGIQTATSLSHTPVRTVASRTDRPSGGRGGDKASELRD